MVSWTRGAGSRGTGPGAKKSSCFYALLFLCLLGFATGGCGASSTPSGTANTLSYHVTFALERTPSTNDTGLYVALAKGWYKQQGITLTLLPYSNSVSPDQLVSSGRADFGISYAETLTENRALNQPLVSVAAIFQHNTTALVSLKKSGLDSIGKLAGKRFAGSGSAWEQPLISQILRCRGASTGAFQNIPTDLDPVAALQSGKFDFAIMEQGVAVIQAEYAGVALNVFPFTENCVPDTYEVTMIGNEPFLRAHPDVARRFLAATVRGYAYAAQNPQEATDLLVASAPRGSFPDQQEIFASQKYQSSQYINDGRCWGRQTLQRWTDYPRFMYTHNAVVDAAGKPITREPDYAAAFTNEFLPVCL